MVGGHSVAVAFLADSSVVDSIVVLSHAFSEHVSNVVGDTVFASMASAGGKLYMLHTNGEIHLFDTGNGRRLGKPGKIVTCLDSMGDRTRWLFLT